MKKLLFLLLCFFSPLISYALDYPEVNSQMVEVYDLTEGKVLYELDSNNKASIASITKIATTITAIETIDNIDEKVTITSDILNQVSWEASTAGLEVGDVLTYRDLVYATIVKSGADAAISLAVLSSGDTESFVEKMNKKAQEIGLEHTHFENVIGLDDEEHYSTADDVRKLLEYALKNELFRSAYTTRDYTLSNGRKISSTIYTYNRGGRDTSKIIGSKTGFTLEAGYCFTSLSKVEDHEMIIIVLKAEAYGDDYYNIIDTIDLIDFVTENYKNTTIVNKGDFKKEIPVSLSKTDNYTIKSDSTITKFLPIDYNKDDIKIKYDGLEELSYKNKEGSKIGEIKYYYQDELLKTEEVLVNEKITPDYLKIIKTKWLSILLKTIGIIFLIFILLIIRKKIRRMKRRMAKRRKKRS